MFQQQHMMLAIDCGLDVECHDGSFGTELEFELRLISFVRASFGLGLGVGGASL